MIGEVIAQAQRYVNIILEPSTVTPNSIQESFYGAGDYLKAIDYSQTEATEGLKYLHLDRECTHYNIEYTGKTRLNRDIINARRYVRITLEGDDVELENADYLFQCGEYLVGDVDLSKIKNTKSIRKIADGDINVTNVTIDTSKVLDASYAFRNTEITRLDMNEYRSDLVKESYEGIISGVTTLEEILIDNRDVSLWNDVKNSLSNDIREFSANGCDYIESLDASNWTACELFELTSENLSTLTLFSNKNELKSFVLKAPKVNVGSTLTISSDNLERFELESKGPQTLAITSPKVKSIDLTKCADIANLNLVTPAIEELDVSGTSIETLDISGYEHLKSPGTVTGIKGWMAKNCLRLETVTMRMDQVRYGDSDSHNQLEGCPELKIVTVYTDSEGKQGGLEYHYGTEYHYGKMYLDGKEITPGGGSVEAINITKAEYEALPESEKMKDVYYNITDDGVDSDITVQTIEQSLSEEQKAQARANIGVSNYITDEASFKRAILNVLYPVGTVQMFWNTVNPNTQFGGKWVKLASGKFVEQSDSDANLGKEVAAGLPDISGHFDAQAYNTGDTCTGAFKPNRYGNVDSGTSQSSNYVNRVEFKASNSNNTIYGKSTTVQPSSYKVNIWRRTE